MELDVNLLCHLLTFIAVSNGEIRQLKYEAQQSCSSDHPYSTLKTRSRLECSTTCSKQTLCRDYNFDSTTKECFLYLHKPLFYEPTPACKGYKRQVDIGCLHLGPVVPSTIPSSCCAIPFTLNGLVHYKCVDNGGGVGCFYGDREWKLCQQPADFEAAYTGTYTTALSADPAVSVPLQTINGWILMVRKVTGGSVSFNKNWAAYRDGFGSPTDNDNYWLGLEKVYCLVQMGSVRVRIEIRRTTGLRYSAEYSTFSISDEVGYYQLTVGGYSGDAGDAFFHYNPKWRINGKLFSTPDVDNDAWAVGNCAAFTKQGWWNGECSASNINDDDQNAIWSVRSDINRHIPVHVRILYTTPHCHKLPLSVIVCLCQNAIWTIGKAVWDVTDSRMLIKLN